VTEVIGDGWIVGSEVCDDKNKRMNDGCTNGSFFKKSLFKEDNKVNTGAIQGKSTLGIGVMANPLSAIKESQQVLIVECTLSMTSTPSPSNLVYSFPFALIS